MASLTLKKQQVTVKRFERNSKGEVQGTRWCLSSNKKTLQYRDIVRTACGWFIIFPLDFSYDKKTTCPDCLKRVSKNTHRS